MDKIIASILDDEIKRQKSCIELIASENFVSEDILKLQGSVFTNKYAEGYPGNRYYNGVANMDAMENLAIDYAKKLFDVQYVNVQPHSGSSANIIVYNALLKHGDKILGMNLFAGGHLTHGYKYSYSGQNYEAFSYGLDANELIDYEELLRIALEVRPKLIIAGASAYSKEIDFAKFREIASKCGALLMVDMSHIAGLVAAKCHMSPSAYADVITTTTHKTLRGPRGGMIMTNNKEIAKKIDKAVFPYMQGGPLMHVIAAKAQCFYEALDESFIIYQQQVLKNAKVLAKALQDEGFRIVSGGTDNHLLIVDVKASIGMTGLEASLLLEKINIMVNKNMIPNDLEKPNITSGIRMGSAAMTTCGFKEKHFKKLGMIISRCLKNYSNADLIESLKLEVELLLGDNNE